MPQIRLWITVICVVCYYPDRRLSGRKVDVRSFENRHQLRQFRPIGRSLHSEAVFVAGNAQRSVRARRRRGDVDPIVGGESPADFSRRYHVLRGGTTRHEVAARRYTNGDGVGNKPSDLDIHAFNTAALCLDHRLSIAFTKKLRRHSRNHSRKIGRPRMPLASAVPPAGSPPESHSATTRNARNRDDSENRRNSVNRNRSSAVGLAEKRSSTVRSRIELLQKFARNLNGRIVGVLAHCHRPLHTGLFEGTNKNLIFQGRVPVFHFPRPTRVTWCLRRQSLLDCYPG